MSSHYEKETGSLSRTVDDLSLKLDETDKALKDSV
jgi:hypothetical protein